MKSLPLVFLLLAACGDDGAMTQVDAPTAIDAPTATVMKVTCPALVAATVMTTDASFSYSPMATTISVGQIVKFNTSSSHDVKPNPIAPKTDSGLSVGFNEMTCLKFTATGTFGFVCSLHSFAGTITVN
jgi:plastocyanin